MENSKSRKNIGGGKKPKGKNPSGLAVKYRDELKALAQNLPFKDVILPEFSKKSWCPVSVRQPRTYTRPEAGMQAVSRFLIERGMVEILTPKNTLNLFKEIHWGIYQVKKLSRRRYKTTRELHKGLREARAFISEIEAAEEELFIANRRLVAKCIKPFFWIGQIWLADFLQEGSKALSNAIRKFDFSRGTPFYAYAQRAVQNRLRNYFRDHVRAGNLGIQPNSDMVKIRHIQEDWVSLHGREPSAGIIEKLTDISLERINRLLPLIKQWTHTPGPPLSLDDRFCDGQANLYQFIEDDRFATASNLTQRAEIWAAVEKLPPRSQQIMRLRFLEGFTLQETGDKIGLTRARIKQIQDEALKKLRKMLKSGAVVIKE